ncbi:MAG: hypothetical protein ACXVEB_16785, partial [Bacteroidia bacterium]
MKKVFSITLLILFTGIKLNAQTIKIEWGKPTQDPGKKLNPVYFIGKDDKFIYLQKTGGMVGTIIEKYNLSNLSRVYSQDLNTPGFKFRASSSSYNFIKLILIKDKLLFITSETEKDNHILYATEIGPNGQLTNNKTKIMEVPFSPVGKHDVISYTYNSTFFDVTVANDNSSFYAYPTTIENTTFPIDFVDAKLNITEKTFPVNLKERGFVDHLTIQDDNAILFICTPFTKKEQFKNEEIGYTYSCASLDLKKNTISINDLALNNQQLIISTSVSMDDKKNLYFYGFYTSDKSSINESTGMFYLKFNFLTGKKLSELDYDNDDEMIQSFNFSHEKDKIKKRRIADVQIQKIIPKEDGGIIVIAEKNYQG